MGIDENRLKSRNQSHLKGRRANRLRREMQVEFLEARNLFASDSNPFYFEGNEAVRGELLVQFSPNATATDRGLVANVNRVAIAESIYTKTMQSVGSGVLERVRLNPDADMRTTIDALKKSSNVLFVEPNYIYRAAVTSNDSLYTDGRLWGMFSDDTPTAVGPSGTTNQFGSQAEKAWNKNIIGSSSIVVGVIDEGIQVTHPDLVDNIWVNPVEIAGNGTDDDGNGYVDDINGWDFFNNDNTVFDGIEDDHGTHVAGTIGATGGNGTGVVGVNWDVSMISLKFLGPNGGPTSAAVRAVDYATDIKSRLGINVVATNNSWGGGGYSQALHDAIIRGAQSDILFVASAGNDSSNNDLVPKYPANYDTSIGTATQPAASYDAVIAVAAINSSGDVAGFSNYGVAMVDIGAPGQGIWSTVPSSNYSSYDGTSMAAPHVAGAVALYASTNPKASAASIRQVILDSAIPTASLSGRTVTGARLDVFKAVENTKVVVEDKVVSPGPILIGVQPNNSELIVNGAVRTVAPRELTFRFDDKQIIDPATTKGIRVTRAGSDGSFGLPSASSDFGSKGRVDIQLTSKVASEPLTISITRSDLGTSKTHELSLSGSNVSIVLNSNAGARVTAEKLVEAINATSSKVFSKLTARINGGLRTTELGTEVPTTPIQLLASNDQIIVPGAVIIGDTPNENEVTLRFAENLPDDMYRLEVFGFDDATRGVVGLRNNTGGLFIPRDPNSRQDTIEFRLDLGSKITGVVPQPVIRNSAGQLEQKRKEIVVYFDDEKLFVQNEPSGKPTPGSVEDRFLYQLIETKDTVRNTDDNPINPDSVTYNASANTVTLTFSKDINDLKSPGSNSTFRLRIGTSEAIPSAPVRMLVSERGSSFDTAEALGTIGSTAVLQTSLVLSGKIDPETHQLDLIGSNDDPGTRRVPDAFQNYLNPNFTGDRFSGIETIYYNFKTNYGRVGTVDQTNSITEKQKARIREAFSLWSDRIGVQFVETLDSGLTVAVGSLAVLNNAAPADVQRRNINGGTDDFGVVIDNSYRNGLAVFSADYTWKDNFGEDFTRASMASIGLLLGLANAGDADPSTLMKFDSNFLGGGTDRNFEPIFPGNLDVLRASFLHRPESSDIDLYQFDVDFAPTGESQSGVFVAETLAERQTSSSPLDTRIALFQQTQATAVSNLGVGGGVQVDFTAIAPGKLGNNLQIIVTRSDLGKGVKPLVRTRGPLHPDVPPNTIVVELNTNEEIVDPVTNRSSVSSLDDFITALQSDPAASALVKVNVKSGDRSTLMGDKDTTYSPIILQGGSIDLIAQNDDYFSKDSLIRMNLSSGRYYIGVSASGNDSYDATVANTGFGGRTQGAYDLRLTFRAQTDGANTIRDAANQPNDPSVPLDGDADGIPGGVYDFWFDTRPLERALNFNAGYSASLEGQIVTITGFTGVVQRFEFSADAAIGNGNTRIICTPTSTAEDLARALVTAINSRSGSLRVSASLDLMVRTKVILKEERLVQLSSNLNVIDIEGKTIFVDKIANANADGSQLRPFNNIAGLGVPNAFAAAVPKDIVRIVGNGGNDNRLETNKDNFAYEIGLDPNGSVLSDGQTMDIPKGVSVMVDAGAIFKLRRARIGVGSSTIGIDRSGGAFQVLGAPKLRDASGNPVRNADGSLATGQVFFTSWLDEQIGFDSYSPKTTPVPGDWGGIFFKRDLDKSVGRFDLEDEGIFRQYVNFADIQYGGSSSVVIDSVQQTVNSVQISDMRPTITFNRIRFGADSAISSTPDSFEETLFSDPRYQRKGAFTPDYDRIGPSIHDNLLVNNSINGMFIKVSTPAGGSTRQLTVPGRFNDTDVVHVIAENILVQGNPGGGLLDTFVIPSNLISLQVATGGTLTPSTYRYKLTFVDSNGYETPPSDPTKEQRLTAGQTAIRITGLPGVGNGYVGRRLYRSDSPTGSYRLVAELDGNTSTFFDRGAILADPSDPLGTLLRDRPDVSGVIPITRPGGTLLAGTYTYRIVMVDALGRESLASNPTSSVVIPIPTGPTSDRTIEVPSLPPVQPGFVGRRIYRMSTTSTASVPANTYTLVSDDASITSFIDDGLSTLTGTLSIESLGTIRPRLDASLAIDPGTIIKLEGARIELGHSTQLLAEGVDGSRVVMTSRQDDRFGAGGTFDTNNNGLRGATDTKPGDWSGIYTSPGANLSLDHVVIASAGGISRIEGTFKAFSPVEIQQADARIANSLFEGNANGMGGQGPVDRFGRPANENYPEGAPDDPNYPFVNNRSRGATVFFRGTHPIFLDNILQNNAGVAITIDVNSMDAELRGDNGRQTGHVDRNLALDANRGPLFRGNRLFNNSVNGLEIRADAASSDRSEGALSVRDLPRNILTTDSVWDDTDIVHVLFDSVVVSNLQHVGGLRLQSAVNESLVIKLEGQGSNFDHERGTGFTATGRYSSITDRVGGTVQVLGMPGFPVVFTSFRDDSVGAGTQPDGRPQTDTNNDGIATIPRAGDWRSLVFDSYSNDRNVVAVMESERPNVRAPGVNDSTISAQFLGSLAQNPSTSDENLVLGWVVNGVLSEPADQDLYSFTGRAGTEVWFDIDGTDLTLDSVIEVLNANGDMLARSDDSTAEQLNPNLITRDASIGANAVNPVVQRARGSARRHQSNLIKEDGTTNPRDAGLRMVLPGVRDATSTFFFRVRSKGTNIDNPAAGLTSGSYAVQVRLRDQQEFAGSTVQYADIRYATNGVHTLGLPYQSPLTGEAHSNMLDSDPSYSPSASVINLGPLHLTNKGAISVAGELITSQIYTFTVGDLASTYVGTPSSAATFPVVIDIDYADGLNRADLIVQVERDVDNDASTPGIPVTPLDRGRLTGRSLIVDDLPGPLSGNELSDLSRGSVGTRDPFLSFIGTAELQRGTYQIRVTKANPSSTLSGVYQMEIRVGDEIGSTLPSFYRGSYSTSINFANLNGFDILSLSDRQFDVSDGANRLTFEFTDNVDSVGFGNVPVVISAADAGNDLARKFRDAVNQIFQQNRLNVRAADQNRNATGTSGVLIDLFGNVEVFDPNNVFTPVGGTSGILEFNGFGDQNSRRDQGQFIVSNTIVSKARDYAVWAAPAEKYYADGRAQQPLYDVRFFPIEVPNYVGAPTLGGAYARNLPENNLVPFGAAGGPPGAEQAGVTPGLVVVNNVFDSSGLGGLHIQGDTPTWRVTARPGAADLDSTVSDPQYPDHSGGYINDGNIMDVTFGRQRVRFEFEDIAGAPTGGPAFGSGVVGGNGWNPENIPVYYREDGGSQYLRVPNTTPGYAADEVVKAIRDAFIGSVLTTNGTTQHLSSWLEPQQDEIPGDPDDPRTWTWRRSSFIVKGPQNIIINAGGVSAQQVGEFMAAPFVRALNNTIIGNDGRAPFNAQATDSDSNDTIAGAAETFQGLGVNPPIYFVNGTLGADPLSQGSSDVDFYKFHLEVGDRVRIDVDTPRGSKLDSTLKVFDSNGVPQIVSREADPTTSDNRNAPGESIGVDPYIDFTATKAGTYYVAISAAGNTQYDAQSLGDRRRGGSSGNYSLNLQVLKPEQFVIVVDDPASYTDGETFSIQQVADLGGGTSNSRTFEFTRNAGYNGGNIPVFIGPEFRVPDLARSIANAITLAGMSNSQSLPNGIFGTANPLAPVSAVALGGHNGFNPTYGVVGTGDFGINSGNVRGAQLQSGLNRYRDWTEDLSPTDLLVNIGQSNGVTSSSSTFYGHANQGFGHDRTMSLPYLPTVDRPVTAQGNGTSEKFVVVRNAYAISSSTGRRIAGRTGTNNLNQIIPETGIMVSGGASPTLLNNSFVNVQTPIVQENPTFAGVDFRGSFNMPSTRPSAVVVGGNTYQYMEPSNPVTNLGLNVEAAPTNVPNTGLDFNFIAGNSEKLFVNFTGGNFLPGSQSQIIDSSIDSMPERSGFGKLKESIGIAPSPVLAPDRDFYGLFRADDPNIAPPSGLGGSIFKDRGAIDRADFVGPTAIAVNPTDNDSRLVDIDPTESVIELTSGVYPEFRIQLKDGFEFANLGGGTGIEDNSVVGRETVNRTAGAAITITENNRLLVEGIDYVFSYNTTTNEIVLKPLAGVWQNDRVFEISINNKDRFVIDTVAGSMVNDGDSFVIRDSSGADVNFEFDSVFRLQLPLGLQLNIPLAGGGAGGIVDGESFSIQLAGVRRDFEFDSDSNSIVAPTNTAIPFTSLSTKAQLADAIVTAIKQSFGRGDVAKVLASNDVFIAGALGDTVRTVNAPSLTTPTQTVGLQVPTQGTGIGGVSDGQTFRVSDGRSTLVFEFDSGTTPSIQAGNVRVDISAANTSPEIARAIQGAIASSGLKVKPSVVGNSVVYLGLPDSGSVALIDTRLEVVSVSRTIQDGDFITINIGAVSKTFEFDNNGSIAAGRVAVPFTNAQTQSEIGEVLAAAITGAGLGLTPKHFGNGNVIVGGAVGDSVSVTGAPTVDLYGQPGVQGNTTLQILGTLQLVVPTGTAGKPTGDILKEDSTFTISNNGSTVRFEFDSNFSGPSTLGNEVIRFTKASTQNDIVAAIITAINSVPRLNIVARTGAAGRVDLGLLDNSAVNVFDSRLSIDRGLAQDGDFFTISNGTQAVTFEFVNLSIPNGSNPAYTPIRFVSTDTRQRLYETMRATIKSSILNLDSEITTQGLQLKDNAKFIYVVDNAVSMRKLGYPGGSIAIPFIQDPAFTPEQMRESIINAINKASAAVPSLTTLQAKVRGGSTLFVENAVTIGDGVRSYFLRGVQDVAGNFLKSNRINNETQFKILMPGVVVDFGDAPDAVSTTAGRYPTLKANDGARHVVTGSSVRLGSSISSELEARQQPSADGDADDGVSFKFQRNDYGRLLLQVPGAGSSAITDNSTFTVTNNGITVTFEFDKNASGASVPGNEVIKLTAPLDSMQLSNAIAKAINDFSGLGLVAKASGSDKVDLGFLNPNNIGVLNSGLTTTRSEGVPIFNKNMDTSISVFLNAPGLLNGWIDFNADGDWSDPGEQILTNEIFDPLNLSRTFQVHIPATAPDLTERTTSFARFRVSTGGNLLPIGLAVDGEVEDYQVFLQPGKLPIGNDDSFYVINEDAGTLIADDALGLNSSTFDDGVLANDKGDTGRPSSSTLNATIITAPPAAAGAFFFNSKGTFEFTPAKDFFGDVTFVYLAADDILDAPSPSTVTITVRPVNDPPVPATYAEITINEDTKLEILESKIVNDSKAGPPNEIGQRVLLTGVNRASEIQSVTMTGTPTSGSFTLQFNSATTTPISWNATAAGVKTALEALSSIGTGNVEVVGGPLPGAPLRVIFKNGLKGTNLNQLIADGSSLVGGGVSVATLYNGGGGSVSLAGGKITYTPPEDFSGTDYFTYIIKDDGNVFTGTVLDPLETEGTISINVLDKNDPPIISVLVKKEDTNEDTEKRITISQIIAGDTAGPKNEIDPPPAGQGQTLVPSKFRVDRATAQGGTVEVVEVGGVKQVLYKPKLNFNGRDTFVYYVTDDGFSFNGTVSDPQESKGTFTVDVSPVNDPPEIIKNGTTAALPRTESMTEDQTPAREFVLSDYFTDPDFGNGDKLTYTVVSNSNQSLFNVANGSELPTGRLSLTPEPDKNGQAVFKIRATDLEGKFIEGDLTVNVTPVTDIPRLRNPFPNRLEKEDTTSISIQLISASTDAPGFFHPDGSTLFFTAVSSDTNIATVSVSGSILTITQKPNMSGSTRIDLTARDSSSVSVPAFFTLAVEPVNDPPVARPDFYTIPLDEVFRTTDATGSTTPTVSSDNGLLANDTDVDGGVLTATVTVLPTKGSVVVNSNGTFVYTPDPTKTIKVGETDTFKYRANDNDPTDPKSSNEVTVTITFGQPTRSRYQNPANPNDVNADGWISPIDALLVINLINRYGGSLTKEETAQLPGPPDYVDVNGDKQIDPLDVLIIINAINAGGNGSSSGGEGESSRDALGWSWDSGRGTTSILVGPLEINAQASGLNSTLHSLFDYTGTPRLTSASSSPAPSALFGFPAEDDDLDKVADDIVSNGTRGSQDLVDQVFADLFDEEA